MTQKKKLKNRVHNPLPMADGSDLVLHIAVILLSVFGIIMIGSASMGSAVTRPVTLILNIVKQLLFVAFGYFLMSFASRKFKTDFLKGNTFAMLIILLVLMLLACRAFTAVNGSYAWIRIPLGPTEVTIQPSEFAKIAAFLLIAGHLADRHDAKGTEWDMVKRPFGIILMFLLIIMLIQKDLGSAAVLLLISMICVEVPKNRKLKKTQMIIRVLIVLGVVGAVYILSPSGEALIEKLPLKDYQKNRFLSAINPFEDPYNNGYQLIQSLIAFADGGLFGRGLGQSIRKYMNFPEATNDFILAIVVEELGFVGFCFLMVLYGIIIFKLLDYARKIRNETGQIILVGTAMYFLIHIFLNVGGVTGLIPLTGVPLPLMSSGGSSAMSFMLSIGLSQSVIARYNRERRKEHADHRR